MMEYQASRPDRSSSQRGRSLGDPFCRFQKIPSFIQTHGLDHHLPAPEISRDDSRLVRAFLIGT